MEINVNKGIISFSYEHLTKGTTLSYQYDINNNVFIGKSGKQVKTIQNKTMLIQQLRNKLNISSFYHKANKDTPNSLTLISFLYSFEWGNQMYLNYFRSIIPMANKLDSLNLDIVKHLRSMGDISYLSHLKDSKDIKIFKEWFETKLADNINFIFSFEDFIHYYDGIKLLEEHPLLKDITNIKERDFVINYFYKGKKYNSFNKEEKAIAEYYYIQRNLYKIDFFEQAIYGLWSTEKLADIDSYFTTCKKIDIKPQKEKDFLRLYKDTLSTYYYNKQEYDNKTFKRNYEKQKNAFTFSYGDYEIVIPQQTQDLVKEGHEMHHCVGSYIERILKNRCYIVFVRNKSDLNTPYITAEVDINGKLGQYYLAYDKRITRTEDKEFKEMFQIHLIKNWVDLD